VKLNVPGQDVKVPILSNKILPPVEKAYAQWTKKEVTLMPEIQEGFALMPSQPVTVDLPDDDETQRKKKEKVLKEYQVSSMIRGTVNR
jgi:hypothetical protein